MTAPEREDTSPDAAGGGTGLRAIGRKAGRGLRWTLFGTLATKAGSFVMSLVLARLLVPHDFGLYAIALAATQFVMHVNDLGIIAATVQWRGRLEDMAPTASTLAIGFSAAWYALFWFAAPFLAELAGSPEATTVVRLLTAVIIIDGITAVRVATLQRTFRHDRLTLAIMAGFAANATLAITLAASGAGAFSFVYGQLTASVVTGTLVMIWSRVPLRYRVDREVARKLIRFGVPLAAGLGVESILLYADSIIVGNVVGAVALGFYLMAFNVSSWVPGLLGTAIRYVSIPSFSRLAEDTPETLNAGARHAFRALATAVLPVAVTLGMLAPSVVVFLYGDRWAPAGAALRFLAVVMVARMVTALAFDILTSLGATRATVWLNLGWAAALIPALLVGTRADGIRGAAVAHALVAVLVAIPLAVLTLRRCGVHLGPLAPSLARPFGGAAAATAVIWLLGSAVGPSGSAFLHLLVAGGGGLVVYLLVVVPPDRLGRLPALVRGALAGGPS